MDRVVDINFYPTEEAKSSNHDWRPVGLGLMGMQDLFFKMRIPFTSEKAHRLSSEISETIYYQALTTSMELAKKMGVTVAHNVRDGSLKDVQKELGMSEGFDVGLEMSGNAAAFRDMLANMCHGAKIALLGIPTRELAIDWNTVIFNMLTIKGI